MNRKTTYILVVAMSAGGLWWSQQSSAPEKKELPEVSSAAEAAPDAVTPENQGETGEESAPPHDADHGEEVSAIDLEKMERLKAAFHFEQEVQEVNRLKEEYPKSRKKLLQVITAADLFSREKISAPEHTIYEVTQRQMGAVKVLALKVLLEREPSKENLLKDLQFIESAAQDSTLKDIARAASASVQRDRPFIRDTVEALAHVGE